MAIQTRRIAAERDAAEQAKADMAYSQHNKEMRGGVRRHSKAESKRPVTSKIPIPQTLVQSITDPGPPRPPRPPKTHKKRRRGRRGLRIRDLQRFGRRQHAFMAGVLGRIPVRVQA